MDKKQFEKILSHPLFIGIFTCLCLLGIFSLQESSKQALVSKESIQKLEQSTAIIEQELIKEQKKVDEKQEKIILEKIMRNELLQKKDGEIVLQIPEKETANNHNENLETQSSGPLKEWKKLFSFQENY